MRNIGHDFALVAELWGALMGLQLAWDMGITHLILEVDNKNVVDIIGEGGGRHRY